MAGRRVGAVVAALVALAGCGFGYEKTGDEPPDLPSTTELPALEASSPFTVGAPPDGYTLVDAGVGTETPAWGSDSLGTNEPVTVLAPGGDVTSPDLVIVSVTGFTGYQDGIDQAASGEVDAVEVDGHDARYAPATDEGDGATWSELVVVRDDIDDLAVRVTAPDAPLEELAEVYRRVAPAGQERGPLVDDPPGDLEVVGSASIDAQMVADALSSGEAGVRGTALDHLVAWEAGVGDAVIVATVPGAGLDPAALPGLMVGDADATGAAQEVDVDGRPGITVDSPPGVLVRRWLAVPTDWGDTLFVAHNLSGDGFGGGADPADLMSVDELVALAASVTEADQATWDDFVATAPA